MVLARRRSPCTDKLSLSLVEVIILHSRLMAASLSVLVLERRMWVIAVELGALHQPVRHDSSASLGFRSLTISRGHSGRRMAAFDWQRTSVSDRLLLMTIQRGALSAVRVMERREGVIVVGLDAMHRRVCSHLSSLSRQY